MIHSLKIINFSSFAGEGQMSLRGGKTATQDGRFVQTASGQSIAKAAVIFGSNASGKTNFLKGLAFLSWFVLSSWQEFNQDDETTVQPFAFRPNQNQPTEFEIVTEDEAGNVFTYALSLTRQKVMRESLMVRKTGATRRAYMFVRKEDNIKLYPASKCKANDVPRSLIRSNSSFISVIRKTSIQTFNNFIKTIMINCNVSNFGRAIFDFGYEKIIYYNKDIKKRIEQFIEQCDTGIHHINVNKIEDIDKNITIFEVYVVHNINGKEYILPIGLESNGTRQLISLLVRIFMCFESGNPLIFDELEFGIHPNILTSIFELFYSPVENPHNAQLICTSHASIFMNGLNKKQIFFTQKNDFQESEIYSLDSFEFIRNDDNFEKKYIAGAYGGIPNL